MLTNNFGVAGVVPTTTYAAGVVPTTVGYSGVGYSGVGAPVLGSSGVYGGAPIATTNQFYNQPYQGLFGLGCPWWVWLIFAIILIGGFIASLGSWCGGSERRERRRENREREENDGKGHHLHHIYYSD